MGASPRIVHGQDACAIRHTDWRTSTAVGGLSKGRRGTETPPYNGFADLAALR